MTPGIADAETAFLLPKRFCEADSCVHAAVLRQSDLDLHHMVFFKVKKSIFYLCAVSSMCSAY